MRTRTPTQPVKPRLKPYRPQVGELVRDQRTGRLGTYMDTRSGEVYLRPLKGGTEWTTTPAAVEQHGDVPAIAVGVIPDARYYREDAGSADAA
ncbi:hypothetical protein [Kitasatospora sp. NPDC094011]|uniref:hypothetical protein n=1 Tax=Kitasatospora sp. NPDC094011 TaxID=3364090 RepID=UPI00380FBCB2